MLLAHSIRLKNLFSTFKHRCDSFFECVMSTAGVNIYTVDKVLLISGSQVML